MVVTPPAFLFDGEDFQAGMLHMSPAAVGVCSRWLCHQWSHGLIPNDRRQLMQIDGCFPDERDALRTEVSPKFREKEDGSLSNARLETIRDDLLAARKQKNDAGKRGANARWRQERNDATAMAEPERSQCLSSSFSSPISLPEGDYAEGGNGAKYPPAFEALWAAVPKHLRREKSRVLTNWQKAVDKLREGWTCPDGGSLTPEMYLVDRMTAFVTSRTVQPTTDDEPAEVGAK